MIDWKIWFSSGIEHILDISGYDHMLFVTLLALAFPVAEWKKLLSMITAFTAGHSLTLALSVTDIIRLNQPLIELLIVLTIACTATLELFYSKNTVNRGKVIYLIIACFGLIHGMGFSFLLKSMLGHEETIIIPLLMFNLGLEAGQIVFVFLIVVGLLLINKYLKPSENLIKRAAVGLIFVVSIFLCYYRFLNILHQ